MPELPELSRRRFLTGTSLGVAGLAASTLLPGASTRLASSTGAAGASGASSAGDESDLSAVGGDVIAHVRDASTGEVTIMVGGTEVLHRDPALVARLLKVARRATPEA
jgi:hypothetical protein